MEFFEKEVRKMSVLMESMLLRKPTPLSISTVMKVLDGLSATEPWSQKSLSPWHQDTSASTTCGLFFSLKLLILLRLDGIKYPPSVIRVFNFEPISFNLKIPQQSSNQLCSSPKMDVVSPLPA